MYDQRTLSLFRFRIIDWLETTDHSASSTVPRASCRIVRNITTMPAVLRGGDIPEAHPQASGNLPGSMPFRSASRRRCRASSASAASSETSRGCESSGQDRSGGRSLCSQSSSASVPPAILLVVSSDLTEKFIILAFAPVLVIDNRFHAGPNCSSAYELKK